jgi:hypothetical protein
VAKIDRNFNDATVEIAARSFIEWWYHYYIRDNQQIINFDDSLATLDNIVIMTMIYNLLP